MLEIHLAIPELDGLLRALERHEAILNDALREGMDMALAAAEEEIVDRTPVDTGNLRDRITSRVEGAGRSIRGIVEVNNILYARWVEEGTRPHIIEARNGRALAFQPGAAAFRIGSRRPQYRIQRGRRAGKLIGRRGPGTMIIVRRVRHPGTQGAHMFRDGAQAAEPRIRSAFAAATRRGLRRLAGK